MSVTLAIIKPNIIEYENEIESEIIKRGFNIIAKRKEYFTSSIYKSFYEEHKGKYFFDELINFMSSGISIVLALENKDRSEKVIQEWRDCIGPTDVKKAKQEFPSSLRALYGNAEIIRENGFHGSATKEDAEREIHLMFLHY
jgi:nucleoside diphosphate kinase